QLRAAGGIHAVGLALAPLLCGCAVRGAEPQQRDGDHGQRTTIDTSKPKTTHRCTSPLQWRRIVTEKASGGKKPSLPRGGGTGFPAGGVVPRFAFISLRGNRLCEPPRGANPL